VSFWGAKFGDGDVFFIDAEFGDGDVSFNSTEFGNGSVNFKSAEFGEGEVRFIDAKFGDAELALENVNCKGRFYLSYIDNAPVTSFRNAAFDNAVMIDRVSFRGVPDFVNTKLTHQLSLHGLEFTLNRASRFHLKAKDEDGVEQLHNKFREVIEGKQVSTDISRYLGMKRAHVGFFKRATWAKDAERLNRLKELAENNKHHDLAMRCHADEHRAKRWHEMSAPASLLDMAFSVSCNYGQSIWRPILVLVVLIISVTVPYTLLSDSLEFAVNFNSEMLAFSAANSIPFLTSAREASKSGIEQFYEGQDSLAWVYITMMLQGLASFILLFLIGLGLRNRFRL
jgi:hypothetical protein